MTLLCFYHTALLRKGTQSWSPQMYRFFFFFSSFYCNFFLCRWLHIALAHSNNSLWNIRGKSDCRIQLFFEYTLKYEVLFCPSCPVIQYQTFLPDCISKCKNDTRKTIHDIIPGYLRMLADNSATLILFAERKKKTGGTWLRTGTSACSSGEHRFCSGYCSQVDTVLLSLALTPQLTAKMSSRKRYRMSQT